MTALLKLAWAYRRYTREAVRARRATDRLEATIRRMVAG